MSDKEIATIDSAMAVINALRLRNAELEADLHAKNFQIKGYSARLKEVDQRFPCGHRKLDWDDSYGECVFCKIKQRADDYEKLPITIIECHDKIEDLESGLVAELDKSLDKAVWNEDQALMRAEAFEKDAGKVPVLRLRIVELEARNKDLESRADQWRVKFAEKDIDCMEAESRLKDEARLLLAAKKVSEVAWIVGALEAKGWTCMEDEHEAFAELSGAIDAAQASERKEGE